LGQSDAVEAALARALMKAAEAGRFDVVAQLARELEARRLAREPNVVELPAFQKGRSR
jgi:ribosomal protein S9